MITKHIKNKRVTLGIFFGLTIFLLLINDISISYSQGNGDSFTISNDFIFLELGEDYGEMLNISSFEFPLPSSSWNITNIELNITSIIQMTQLLFFQTLSMLFILIAKVIYGLVVEKV